MENNIISFTNLESKKELCLKTIKLILSFEELNRFGFSVDILLTKIPDDLVNNSSKEVYPSEKDIFIYFKLVILETILHYHHNRFLSYSSVFNLMQFCTRNHPDFNKSEIVAEELINLFIFVSNKGINLKKLYIIYNFTDNTYFEYSKFLNINEGIETVIDFSESKIKLLSFLLNKISTHITSIEANFKRTVYLIKHDQFNIGVESTYHYMFMIGRKIHHLTNIFLTGEYSVIENNRLNEFKNIEIIGETTKSDDIISLICKNKKGSYATLSWNNCQNFTNRCLTVICDKKIKLFSSNYFSNIQLLTILTISFTIIFYNKRHIKKSFLKY